MLSLIFSLLNEKHSKGFKTEIQGNKNRNRKIKKDRFSRKSVVNKEISGKRRRSLRQDLILIGTRIRVLIESEELKGNA